MGDIISGHNVVEGALNTLLLIGILVTAVASLIRIGRWIQKVIDSIEHQTAKTEQIQATIDEHVAEEEGRFDDIESTLKHHGKRIECIDGKIDRLCAPNPGNGT